MYVVLVGAALEENLALQYLAPPLRLAGHEVEVMAFDRAVDADRLAARLARRRPGLVGMSVAFQHRLKDFRDLARAIRAAGVAAPIVWGGHIPTARAGQILDGYPEVDVVVRHDGEESLVALVDALADAPLDAPSAADEPRRVEGRLLARLHAIEGLAFRLPEGRSGVTTARAATRDLDALPWPDRPERPTRHCGLGFAPVIGSRGCWQRCTYCSIQTYHRGRSGPRVRLREPDAVAEEIAALYHERQYRIFCFHDENFFLPRPKATVERLRALKAGLDRRRVGRIGLVAKCRPDQLTPEVLGEARRMGLLRAYVGIENGSQAGLDHLGRETTVATCRRALELLRDAGVYACFNVLLFEPDTVMADVRDNVAFLRDWPDFPWNFCRAEVYPGSLLEQTLREQGRLRGGLEGMSYTIADPRAELLFRMTAVAFGGRNFGPQGTANAGTGLGYLAAVLEHFFPGRAARAYAQQTQHLLRAFHEDTLGLLDRAYAFVEAGPPSRRAVREFTDRLAAAVAASDARYWPAMEALRGAMDRFGAGRAPALLAPPAKRHPLRAAVAAAAAVASLVAAPACETGGGEVVDPAPSDVVDPGARDAHQDMMVVDPSPMDVMVADPLPMDVMVADPLPEDVIVVDPPPPDVDPPPPDIVEEDWIIVDPPPPDVRDVVEDTTPDVMVADPLPPDVVEDVMIADPLPPDVVEDVPPPSDPPPPDMSMAVPARLPALPLDRSFRVQLVTVWQGGSLQLDARVTGAPAAKLRWRAAGGSITARGTGAVFRPDGRAGAWVMVTAEAGGDRLDVARHVVEAPRG